MRKLLLGFLVVAVAATGLYLHFHHKAAALEIDYAANRQVSLWSTTAPVRELVATANYGDRLEVVARSGDQLQVRTANGATGWVGQNDVIPEESWQKAKDLLTQTSGMPVEARGETRVLSNLHLEPSRVGARIWQLGRGVPVTLFQREAVAVPPAAGAATAPHDIATDSTPTSNADADASANSNSNVKKEDWWLVRAQLPSHGDVAGWILGRFVDLSVPSPLPDYANATGIRIVAWFELNRVADESGEPKPQYLVAGTRGAEGQACDFTALRAYTWSKKQEQYETAFAESGLCGKLPVKIQAASAPGGDASFSFTNFDDSGAPATRTYQMRSTLIRRVKEPGAAAEKKRKRSR